MFIVFRSDYRNKKTINNTQTLYSQNCNHDKSEKVKSLIKREYLFELYHAEKCNSDFKGLTKKRPFVTSLPASSPSSSTTIQRLITSACTLRPITSGFSVRTAAFRHLCVSRKNIVHFIILTNSHHILKQQHGRQQCGNLPQGFGWGP